MITNRIWLSFMTYPAFFEKCDDRVINHVVLQFPDVGKFSFMLSDV